MHSVINSVLANLEVSAVFLHNEVVTAALLGRLPHMTFEHEVSHVFVNEAYPKYFKEMNSRGTTYFWSFQKKIRGEPVSRIQLSFNSYPGRMTREYVEEILNMRMTQVCYETFHSGEPQLYSGPAQHFKTFKNNELHSMFGQSSFLKVRGGVRILEAYHRKGELHRDGSHALIERDGNGIVINEAYFKHDVRTKKNGWPYKEQVKEFALEKVSFGRCITWKAYASGIYAKLFMKGDEYIAVEYDKHGYVTLKSFFKIKGIRLVRSDSGMLRFNKGRLIERYLFKEGKLFKATKYDLKGKIIREQAEGKRFLLTQGGHRSELNAYMPSLLRFMSTDFTEAQEWL